MKLLNQPIFRAGFLTLAMLAANSAAHAVNYSYNSTTSANWNVAAAWSPNGNPGVADNIVTPLQYTNLNTNGNRTAGNFTIGAMTADWNVVGTAIISTLTIANDLSSDVGSGRTLTFRSNNSLTARMNLVVGGAVTSNSGTLQFGGTFLSRVNQLTVTGLTTLNGGNIGVAATDVGNAANRPKFNGGILFSGAGGTLSVAMGGNATDASIAPEVAFLETSGSPATQIVQNNAAGSSGTSQTLVINGNTGLTKTFSGIIQNGNSTPLGIAKQGNNTQILSGANTYTGNTTVTAGTLIINGSTSASSAVSVAVGATLGGNGTIGGATTIDGNLNPGNSPGLLTFNSTLTLNGTTTMELAGTGRGSSYDAVNVTGLLTYGGSLTLTMSSAIGNSTYDLFGGASAGALTQTGDFSGIAFAGGAYSGSWSYNGTTSLWTASAGGQTFSFDKATGDLTVIPEPSAFLLVFGGAGALLLTRRRSRIG